MSDSSIHIVDVLRGLGRLALGIEDPDNAVHAALLADRVFRRITELTGLPSTTVREAAYRLADGTWLNAPGPYAQGYTHWRGNLEAICAVFGNMDRDGRTAEICREFGFPESTAPEGAATEAQSSTPPSAPSKAPTDKLSLALATLSKHPDWTAARIAKEVGCSGAYLSKQPKWRAAVQAIKGLGQENKNRSMQHRGNNIDEYPDNNATPAPTLPKCASCEDRAGTDEAGQPLVHNGEPRCLECWVELKGAG